MGGKGGCVPRDNHLRCVRQRPFASDSSVAKKLDGATFHQEAKQVEFRDPVRDQVPTGSAAFSSIVFPVRKDSSAAATIFMELIASLR